jgi:hypothetical protein
VAHKLPKAGVAYSDAGNIRVPRLRDLLAMKIFALAGAGTKREEKDFADIVNLALVNNLDPVADLGPLFREFGNQELFERVSARIRELRDA